MPNVTVPRDWKRSRSTPGLGRPARTTILQRGLWWLGAIALLLVAVASMIELGRLLSLELDAFPGTLQSLGYAIVSIWLLATLVLSGIVVAIARRISGDLAALLIGLTAVALTRITAIVIFGTNLESDWGSYQRIATDSIVGGPIFTGIPPGWPAALALAYRVFGPDPVVGLWLGVAVAVAGGLLFFLIARRAFGSQRAALGLILYAVSPSAILMSTRLGTETIYAVALLLVVRFATWRPDRVRSTAILTGVALAGSQYFRATSTMLVPLVIVWAAALSRTWRMRLANAAILVAVFVIVLGPALRWNVRIGNGPSVSTSTYGGWSILVGMNQETTGRYNIADQELVGLTPGTSEFDARAAALGLERLGLDPLGSAGLAVRKVSLLWGPDDGGVYWAVDRARTWPVEVSSGLRMASQLWWAAIAVGACAWFWRVRSRPSGLVLLIGGIVAAFVAIHLVVEIQPRYHMYVAPLLTILAAGTFGRRLPARSQRRRGRLGRMGRMGSSGRRAVADSGSASSLEV